MVDMDVDELPVTERGAASAKKEKKKKTKKELPENLELQRTHVLCGPEVNAHTKTITSANAYMPVGYDNAWDLAEFKKDFQIKIHKLDKEVMVCDVIGIDPAMANALRRILIAEVPTVCIEHIFMINNTSIIQDEVLSHRLGLIPLNVIPEKLEYKTAEETPSEKNTLVFKLDVHCYKTKNEKGEEVIVNEKVKSSAFQWLPGGSEISEETGCRFTQGQSHMFDTPPAAVHDDILIAKLRPGQSIQLEAHCCKGIGKDHAKFSPVATAWYQLLPEVALLKQPTKEVAKKLQEAAPGLFTYDSATKKMEVGEAREHFKDLEKVRALLDDPAVAETIQYKKKKDHFIFTVESTGILTPDVLFTQALDILFDKAQRLTTLC